jgi:hypothetical protein
MSTSVSPASSGNSLAALSASLQDALRWSAKAAQEGSVNADFQSLVSQALKQVKSGLQTNQAVQSAAATPSYQPTVGTYSKAQAASAAVGTPTGRAQLEQDFKAYFAQSQPGQVVQIINGAVTRNADGSATWQAGNQSYTFTASTPIDEVARNSGLGEEWTKAYGVEWGGDPSTQSVKAPFTDFESFKTWEQGLGHDFAPDYEVPDYISVIGLSQRGGEAEAFKRYVFFNNHPDMAVDYQNIRSGGLSAFPTDGSTLVKSKLADMPNDVAAFYRADHDALRMVEGFNFDPVLSRQLSQGQVQVPEGVDPTAWLSQNKWTPTGIVANDNRLSYASADYIGLSGAGAGTYRLAQWDTATGGLRNTDGKLYDPTSGKLMA